METSSKASKAGRQFLAFLTASVTLAMATLLNASTSTQVKTLDPLVVPRTAHAATALADGRILITGGRDSAGNIVAVSEIFDPATNSSTASATLTTPRVDHTATLLHDGRVLVAGGNDGNGPLNSAEIFDPSNGGFQVLSANMGAARAGHTATVLSNGTVLIAGGDANGTAEIFDPASGTFSSTLLNMAAPRTGHTATLFSDNNVDSVLFAGGNTDSMELFTPADQKFTLDSQVMSVVHIGQEAISLSDTRLLFVGGDTSNTIEEFNRSTDTITTDASMAASSSSATLLANGNILVLGSNIAGLYAPNAADLGSAFTAFDETSVAGSTALLRTGQTATQLSGDKKIFVAGGVNAQNLFQGAALFNPARIWTDQDDYVPGDNVILSGSGWKPNENVDLFAVDSQTTAWTYGSTAPADANGGFVVDPYFIVQLVQQGASFHVTAVGEQSAMQADVMFTDAGNFTYSPSSTSLNLVPGGSSGSFPESVTAQKNNGTFSAIPIMTGTNAHPIDPLWMSLNTGAQSFVTGGSGGSAVTNNWTVTITVPSSVVADGTIYTGHIAANVTSGTGPGTGQGTDVTVTVPDTTPPSPPSAPQLASGSNSGSNADTITNVNTPNFNGTAEPNSTIQLFSDGNPVGSGTTASNGTYSASVSAATPLSDATHTMTAKATDAAGNQSTSFSASSSVTIDTQRPSVTITGPSGTVSTSPINFTATFSEPVTGLTAGNVHPGGTAGATTVVVTQIAPNDGTTYNLAISGMTGNGIVTVFIGQNAAIDTAANGNFISNTASVSYSACTAPSVSAVSPASATKTVGDSVTFSVTATGTSLSYQWRKNGGNIGGATSSSYTINPVALSDAGSYDVVVTNSCGSVTSTPAAILTVNKKTPTINWSDPVDIPYGTALSVTQLNATATYPGAGGSTVLGTFTYTPDTGTVLNAGNNQVLSVGFAPNDTAAYNSVPVTTVHINVLKATPTVMVTDPMPTYDGNSHSATATAKGVGDVDVAGNFTFTYDGSATAPTDAKTSYDVVATFTSTDANYTGATGNGTLTIKKADQTITWSDPANIVYGTVLGVAQLNATVAGVPGGSAPGALTYTPGAGTLLDAGNGQALKVDAAETTNYKPATKTVHINVEKATPVVTWSNPADIVYGTALSGTQLNATFTWTVGVVTGPVAGTATYTPPAGTVLLPGAGQNLTVNFAPSDTTNYNAPAATTVQINVTFGTCSGSGVILQPINANGTSVFPRSGRTVPVKFWVCDASGNSISDPSVVFGPSYPNSSQLKLVSAVRGVITNVNETADNVDVPNAAFRYSDGQWIFNMATTNLQSGMSYTYKINLAYGSITFVIGVK